MLLHCVVQLWTAVWKVYIKIHLTFSELQTSGILSPWWESWWINSKSEHITLQSFSSPHFFQHFLFSFLNSVILMCVRCFTVDLICTFLIKIDSEITFMVLLALYIALEKCLFKSFAYFWVVVLLLLLGFRSFLYFLKIKMLNIRAKSKKTLRKKHKGKDSWRWISWIDISGSGSEK